MFHPYTAKINERVQKSGGLIYYLDVLLYDGDIVLEAYHENDTILDLAHRNKWKKGVMRYELLRTARHNRSGQLGTWTFDSANVPLNGEPPKASSFSTRLLHPAYSASGCFVRWESHVTTHRCSVPSVLTLLSMLLKRRRSTHSYNPGPHAL